MNDHEHSAATCDGIAVVSYEDDAGNTRTWSLAASRCPLRPDTTETIRAHVARWYPALRVVKVDILPIHRPNSQENAMSTNLNIEVDEPNHVIVIEDGVMQFVYSDVLASLAKEGTISRASEVEPGHTRCCDGGWVADMKLSGGPILTADGAFTMDDILERLRMNGWRPRGFATRQAALDAEREWLQKEKGL
jgi:hypothetical protein